MPERGQWRLTDPQRFIVVIMVVAALFLAAMALGMRSLVLVLVAVAMLVIAGLGVFLLGLFYNGRGGVQGTAEVHAVSAPPLGNIRGRCDLRLLVRLDGRPAMMMKHRDAAVPVAQMARGRHDPAGGGADRQAGPTAHPVGPGRATSAPGPAAGSTPAGEPATPVYSGYADELRATGLEYDYVIEDSPTPPHRPTAPRPASPSTAARPHRRPAWGRPRPARPARAICDPIWTTSTSTTWTREPGQPRSLRPRSLRPGLWMTSPTSTCRSWTCPELDLSELDLCDLDPADLDTRIRHPGSRRVR